MQGSYGEFSPFVRTNERSLFANERVNNDGLPVEAKAHQSLPTKKKRKTDKLTKLER